MTRIAPEWLGWPETQALIGAFGQVPLRFVGGSVRDALLARAGQDVDAATPALPEDVLKMLASAGIKAIPTGIDHGTVTAVINRRQFEITTLRKDVATDGRRATVAYTQDWREDAQRRDFTMNALYCDALGEVTDYFGGEEDAKAGRVRFIGDAKQRILEDGLRILRFFRFFAHYGGAEIDREGLAACGELASRIEMLSGERIQQEMLRLLVAARAGEVVDRMQEAGVWAQVVSHKVNTRALTAFPGILSEAKHKPDAILSLAVLLRSVPEGRAALVEEITARWKLSKIHYKRLLALTEPSHLVAVTDFTDAAMKKRLRELGREDFTDRALIKLAEDGDRKTLLAALKLADTWHVPEFPLNGDDLLAHGISPGREMGMLLKKLEQEWEEGGYVANKQELLNKIKR